MEDTSRDRGFVPAVLVAVAVTIVLAGPAQALTYEEVAKLAGPDRQKILEDQAKKEGEVTLYHTFIEDQVGRPMVDAFTKKYPYLKVSSTRNNTAQVMQKITSEVRAKSVRGDVIVTDNIAAVPNSGAAEPFTSPVFAEYPADYIDPGHTWASLRTSWQGIGWNTKMVKPEEAPQSWEALLDPRWKGKMTWTESLDTGSARLIAHLIRIWGEPKTVEYLKKLKTQDIRTTSGSVRTALDLVIAGEFAIGVSMSMHHIAISKSQGAPVDGTSPDPVIAKSNVISFVKGAPHPAAGMLLIDFMLAKDGGQTVLRDAQYPAGHPALEPLPEMGWIMPLRNGKHEMLLTAEEEGTLTKKGQELYQLIFR